MQFLFTKCCYWRWSRLYVFRIIKGNITVKFPLRYICRNTRWNAVIIQVSQVISYSRRLSLQLVIHDYCELNKLFITH